MAESVGMQIVNQRTEDILRAISVHKLTVVDLKRLAKRFHTFAELVDNNVSSLQKAMDRALEGKGGDGGL